MPTAAIHLLLFAGGCTAGALNVVAGGGSFLTVPILILAGLPATVANATNRIGILVQNIGAVWSFDRRGVLEREALPWAAGPSIVGGLIGTWAALRISDRSFERLLVVLMLVITVWIVVDPMRRWRPHVLPSATARRWILGVGFFLAGAYGAFVHAGVGFLMLAATTLAGIDLVRGNAIKVFSALLFTAVSLAIFIGAGKVVWAEGLSLAAGNLVGGLVGARLSVNRGHQWIRGVVTVSVIVLAALLLGRG